MQSLQSLQSLPAQLNDLVRAMCSMCRTELTHDVRLSLLQSRRDAATSASGGAKRAHSGLRGSMEKYSVLGWPKSCKLAHAFLWEHSYKRL